MTDWDDKLLKEARNTKYWEYRKIFEMVDMADSDATKYTLNNIGELMFEVYQQRGYYDPTKEEGVPRVQSRAISFLKGIVQKLLGKGTRKED